MKRAMQNAMRLGAQGIKITSAGRLNGAEIARTEWYREGRVLRCTRCAPTSTTAFSEAKTTYGVIGVKVWVYKGEVLGRGKAPGPRRAACGHPPPLSARNRRSRHPAGKPSGPRPARADGGMPSPGGAQAGSTR